MSKAKITFYECLQNAQELGSDDEHMASRVFFSLEINGKRFEDLFADLKQTVGADYETGSIEVGPPKGYEGAFNHEAFHGCAEKYYRSCVGSEATGIRVGKGARGIRMFNNLFKKEMMFEFEISGGS